MTAEYDYETDSFKPPVTKADVYNIPLMAERFIDEVKTEGIRQVFVIARTNTDTVKTYGWGRMDETERLINDGIAEWSKVTNTESVVALNNVPDEIIGWSVIGGIVIGAVLTVLIML